ncbi:MAG: trehalose synthase [Gemmatales bacterium]|nr:MAG: trehalose synthase [Gemmatales bacterium]
MLDNDPYWYKDAILYELHVRAFQDSDSDGFGDFRGLTDRLDYLQDLGVTAIWLLPFYPSPLKDDGYDIADYTNIHPDYGTLRDFKRFLNEAHERGLRVVTELVINHTSDQHPWFQRARKAPKGSVYRDFYVWSDDPKKYKEARIIFQDFETSNWTWDHVAKSYYWHRFYSHQPDLNFENPEVWKAIFPVLDFWLEMGVDGMRLDAVPYLYEAEGTNCENLPETHAFLRALRKHVDEKFENRMLLAEANQWPEDAVAYFGTGDECHMCFHFPVMPRMFMAIHMEDRFPIIDILDQTPEIPPSCQWAMFLRNHDELTLEMVTDEERDYMYRAYASELKARINLGIRRRLAPLLGNNRRRIELMNGLLLSMPGTPIIYYGDEIGMGDNIYLGDRNGVRTPMQWSADRNAGFSRANPQKLYLPVIIDPEYHFEAVNVEAQQNNPNSLLWWMKRVIALRKRHKAFGRGSIEFLKPENRKILAFLRRYEDETLLVTANLSRFVQYVELDLSEFNGVVPVELFGNNPFPRIGELPYLLTLGPHSFYWFSLPKEPTKGESLTSDSQLLTVATADWHELFGPRARSRLEQLLPSYMKPRRWFGSKARIIKSATIREAVRFRFDDSEAFVTLIRVEFNEGSPETYVLPFSYAKAETATTILEDSPHAAVLRVQSAESGIIYDALYDKRFCRALLSALSQNKTYESDSGEITATTFPHFDRFRDLSEDDLEPSLSKAEQSNTSIVYGKHLILKVFRRVDEGVNPDLEIGRYLTQKGFAATAAVVGAIESRRRGSQPMTLAILQEFVANEGDAWRYTLDALGRYYERVAAESADGHKASPSGKSLLALAEADAAPALAQEMISTYLETARLLGQRTAELHLTLADETEDPNFVPEEFSKLYRRSVYQSMRNLVGRVFLQFRREVSRLPEQVQDQARRVLNMEGDILRRFQTTFEHNITALRTRCHGDYHLGQVLYTGRDFVIIDFEGEPARSITERRLKRSPLCDVAGMVRSFHYAAYSGLIGDLGIIRSEDIANVEPWARFWYEWVSAAFLKSYLEHAGKGGFLPANKNELRLLFDAFLMEKAIYELGYEINHRPDWVRIPLMGILQLLDEHR